jgi:hypothetical protein
LTGGVAGHYVVEQIAGCGFVNNREGKRDRINLA